MKNVLVTGGAGFIGSNFIRSLLLDSPETRIINLDALTYAGSFENLRNLPDDSQYLFIHGDICDEQIVNDVLSKYEIDTIIHFAAESHVDRSIVGPSKFIQTNIVGTFTLLDAAKRYWLDKSPQSSESFRFHHISTDEVYGALLPDENAWTEHSPYSPHSPYSASKASSDHLVRAYGSTFGLPFTITNCSNNYGPYQFPEKLIPLVILNAIEEKPLPIYGDGLQVRDWLYVQDHCYAIIKVLRFGQLGHSYNIGGGNQPTNLFIVQNICDLVDEYVPLNYSRRDLIQFVKDRPGHDRRYAMDSTKISSELGWQPQFTLESGLRKTVKWYLDHPEWVEAIRKQNNYQAWLENNYQNRQ